MIPTKRIRILFRLSTTEVVLFLPLLVLLACNSPAVPDRRDEGRAKPPSKSLPKPMDCRTMGRGDGTIEEKTKLCEIDCSKGDAWSCFVFGGISEMEGRFDKARRGYQSSCTLEEKGRERTEEAVLGCQNIGRLLYLGLGGKKDKKKARQYFKKACNLGYGGGCFILGILYHAEDNDEKKARDYATKAGRLGFSVRTYAIGEIWIEMQDDYADNKYAVAMTKLIPIMAEALSKNGERQTPTVYEDPPIYWHSGRD